VASKRKKPWEQRPRESNKAFAAATIYFQLGAARSLPRVSQEYSRSVPLLKRWSRRWRWVRRARAWDAHMAAIQAEALEARRAETARTWAEREEALRERKYDLAMKMLAKAEAMAAFPLAQVSQGEDGKTTVVKPAKWTFFSLARLAATGSALAQEAIRNEGAIHNLAEELERFEIEEYRPRGKKP